MRVLIVLLVIASCGKASSSNECQAALHEYFARAIERVKDSLDPPQQQAPLAQIEKRRDALSALCTDDRWSADVISCIRDHHAPDDLTVCYRRLDVAQFEKLGALREALRSPAAEAAMIKMREFRDRMCACHDKACADRLSEEMSRWGEAHKDEHDEKVTEDDVKQMSSITEEFSKCMTKVMIGDMGSAAQ